MLTLTTATIITIRIKRRVLVQCLVEKHERRLEEAAINQLAFKTCVPLTRPFPSIYLDG